jgi:hypothetical protein
LNARVERGVEHHFLLASFLGFSADVATLSQLSDESRLAQSGFPAGFLRSLAFTHQDTDCRTVEVAIGAAVQSHNVLLMAECEVWSGVALVRGAALMSALRSVEALRRF